jgi:polyisoprenoid-binding protein YceI
MMTMMAMINGFVLGLAFAFSTASLAADTFDVDTTASKVTWVGTKVVGSHNGTVPVSAGTVEVDSGKPVNGSIEIDFANLVNIDVTDAGSRGKLEGHLKSPDFFNVEKHPKGKFVLKNATPSKVAGEFLFQGDLTVKDITKPVQFPATVKIDGDKATATAKFKINRTDWDIKYNSGKFFDAKKLGDKMIYDEIEVGFDLVANKKDPNKKS